jgi:hypothetical protein
VAISQRKRGKKEVMEKQIIYFGKQVIVACDQKCDKAWGINSRPKEYLSDDPDDYEYLSDDELLDAPEDPGTYEGGHAKPILKSEIPNKWCVRECERCVMAESRFKIVLPDFSKRRKNIPV